MEDEEREVVEEEVSSWVPMDFGLNEDADYDGKKIVGEKDSK